MFSLNPLKWFSKSPAPREVGFNAFHTAPEDNQSIQIDNEDLPPVRHHASDGDSGFRPVTNRDEYGRPTSIDNRSLHQSIQHLIEAAPTMPGLSMYLEANGFRSLNQSLLDFSGDVRLNVTRRARWLNSTNPLASRGMQIRTDMIMSEGFKIEPTSTNPKYAKRVQAVIDDHWQYNQWDRGNQRERDLGVCGEKVRRVPPMAQKIGNMEGEFIQSRFRCGMILPELIETISLDPWDYERPIGIHLQSGMFPVNSKLHLEICSDLSEIEGLNNVDIQGDAFYTAVNRVGGQSRGISDLTPTIEWIDAHDQSLFTDVERAQMLMRFIWDVKLTGADPDTIDDYARKLKAKPPRTNTWRVHNENEEVNAICPDLQVAQTAELRDNLFNIAWGSMGLPKHWFCDAENVNKSNAEEMVTPVFAWARNRRMQTKADLLMEFKLAIQIAARTPVLGDIPKEHLGIKISSRDPDRSKYESLANSTQNFAAGLTAAIQQGLIPQDAASRVFCEYLGSFGIEIKMEEGEADDLAAQKQMQERTQAQQEQQEQLAKYSKDPESLLNKSKAVEGELGSAAQDARVKAGMPPNPEKAKKADFAKVLREAKDKIERARMRADLRAKEDPDLMT